MAAARGREPSLRREFRAALAAGTTPARLDEALLQLILFAGFARAINAFRVLRELVPGSPAPRSTPDAVRRRGEALCRRIYGPVYERMISRMRSYHPDLAAWILKDGYGKVLSRPGLSARERELLVLPVLAALNVPLQLRSHVAGAARVGATKREIGDVLRGCGFGRAGIGI